MEILISTVRPQPPATIRPEYEVAELHAAPIDVFGEEAQAGWCEVCSSWAEPSDLVLAELSSGDHVTGHFECLQMGNLEWTECKC